MRRLSAFTALFVMALAGTALASSEPEIDGTPSVKVVHLHGKTFLNFTGKSGRRLYKQIAGQTLELPCQKPHSTFNPPLGTDGEGRFFAPKRGHKLRVQASRDWCELVVMDKSDVATPIVAVALTPAGKTFLAERLQGVLVDGIVRSATVNAENDLYPPANSQFVSGSKGTLVALASPSDTPPPGKYGYYSDGAHHIAVVAVTSSGKRLFEEVNGDTVSSNVARYVESMDFDFITVGD